jgi:hypothetical protein
VPKADWGVDPSIIDDFDRSKQFKPYAGPIPPDGVYLMRIKQLKYAAGTKSKLAQLRPGLELVPRSADEKRFKGYFVMDFLPISGKTEFRYVPFLDALGITGKEFVNKTVYDADGNVTKIGSWRNKGETLILVQLRTEKGADAEGQPMPPRHNVKWYGEFDPDDLDYDDDDDDDDEDEDEDDDYDEDEED